MSLVDSVLECFQVEPPLFDQDIQRLAALRHVGIPQLARLRHVDIQRFLVLTARAQQCHRNYLEAVAIQMCDDCLKLHRRERASIMRLRCNRSAILT
jgi:hypothetical protein